MPVDKKKHIWILNHYAHPPDVPGGGRHYTIGRELVKLGYHVTIFASSFNHAQRLETKLAGKDKWRVEDVGGPRFVWLKTTPYQKNDGRRIVNWISYAQRVMRVAPRLVRQGTIGAPDVVIGSSVHLLAVYAAYRLSRRFRCPFITEIRDLWPQTLVDMGALPERHPVIGLLRALETYLYKRSDRIVMLLPRAYQYTDSLGIPSKKVVWIPNGVDLSMYPAPADGNGKPADAPFVVMYAGAHGKANALGGVLEAARLVNQWGHSDIRFRFVGNGPEKQRLVDQARQWELGNVEFREGVPRTQIPGVLAEADGFIHSVRDMRLYRYGMSMNKSFDYMASARPIVLAAEPANDYVKEADCGLSVPPNDPRALAEAIVKLAGLSEEERAEMGRRGRAYVEEHHDYCRLAQRFSALFEELDRG